MMPSHANLAAGIPRNEVENSRLSRIEDKVVDLQLKISPVEAHKALLFLCAVFQCCLPLSWLPHAGRLHQ